MKSRLDNWTDIRVFLAVMRAGSTLGASQGLGISQPTVARRIAELEQALKLTLFERDTRGFHPTQEAQRLFISAVEVEGAVAAMAEQVEQARISSSKRIRITAPPVNFSARFAGILSEYRETHPGIHFEFLASYQILDLAAGAADVAIRIAPTISDDRLICSRLTEAQRTLYASRRYAETRGLPASPEEFAGHSFLVFDRDWPSAINDWLLSRIEPGQIASRCSGSEAMVAAIQAGLGIGPLSVSLAADHPGLVPCFDPPPGTSVPTWLVIAPEAYRRPEVRDFAAFFAPRYRSIFRGGRAR